MLFFALLLPALLAIGSTTGCGGDDADRATGETVRLVIPAGTTEKLEAGEKVRGIPDTIEAQVGDTLVVENRDRATQFVSGFAISPGQTVRIPLARAGTYLTNCSAHEDRSIKMIVRGDPAEVAAAGAGAKLFDSAGCAGCHQLSEADAKGPMGPVLDGRDLSVESVRKQVTEGGGAMPAYEDELSPKEIDQLARFVSEASKS